MKMTFLLVMVVFICLAGALTRGQLIRYDLARAAGFSLMMDAVLVTVGLETSTGTAGSRTTRSAGADGVGEGEGEPEDLMGAGDVVGMGLFGLAGREGEVLAFGLAVGVGDVLAFGLAVGVGEVLAFGLAAGVGEGLAEAAPHRSWKEAGQAACWGRTHGCRAARHPQAAHHTHGPPTLTLVDNLRASGHGLCAAPNEPERRLRELWRP